MSGQNIIEQAFVLGRGEIIELQLLPIISPRYFCLIGKKESNFENRHY